MPGNQVVINWTWCTAVNSTVTGIVIYRVSWPKSRYRLKHVLSMDLSKTVHYLKDNLKHELRSIVNKTRFEEKTIFIINNVTTADGGTYSLHVRREGHSDLHSEVQVTVKRAGWYNFRGHLVDDFEGTSLIYDFYTTFFSSIISTKLAKAGYAKFLKYIYYVLLR